ncbi:MAG TPA: hypothetical protein VF721_14365 [Pyrinomonadaceae bacterium]|jgi:hypothetical protein
MKRQPSSSDSPNKSREKKTKSPSKSINKKSLCSYRLQDSDSSEEYQCRHESISAYEPFCIFHIKKPDINSLNLSLQPKAEEIENKFRNGFYKIVSKAELDDSEFIDFRGFQFPKIEFAFDKSFPKKVDFSYAVFNEDVDFAVDIPNPTPEDEWDTFRALLINNETYFIGTVFKGNADFSRCETGKETIDFTDAVLKRTLCLLVLTIGLRQSLIMPFSMEMRILSLLNFGV